MNTPIATSKPTTNLKSENQRDTNLPENTLQRDALPEADRNEARRNAKGSDHAVSSNANISNTSTASRPTNATSATGKREDPKDFTDYNGILHVYTNSLSNRADRKYVGKTVVIESSDTGAEYKRFKAIGSVITLTSSCGGTVYLFGTGCAFDGTTLICGQGAKAKINGTPADEKNGKPAKLISCKNATIQGADETTYCDVTGVHFTDGLVKDLEKAVEILERKNGLGRLATKAGIFCTHWLGISAGIGLTDAGRIRDLVTGALDGSHYDSKTTKFHLSRETCLERFMSKVASGEISSDASLNGIKENLDKANKSLLDRLNSKEHPLTDDEKTQLKDALSKSEEYQAWEKKFNDELNKKIIGLVKKFSIPDWLSRLDGKLEFNDFIDILKKEDNDAATVLEESEVSREDKNAFGKAKEKLKSKVGNLTDNSNFFLIKTPEGKFVAVNAGTPSKCAYVQIEGKDGNSIEDAPVKKGTVFTFMDNIFDTSNGRTILTTIGQNEVDFRHLRDGLLEFRTYLPQDSLLAKIAQKQSGYDSYSNTIETLKPEKEKQAFQKLLTDFRNATDKKTFLEDLINKEKEKDDEKTVEIQGQE